jgi:hypothetical protein
MSAVKEFRRNYHQICSKNRLIYLATKSRVRVVLKRDYVK